MAKRGAGRRGDSEEGRLTGRQQGTEEARSRQTGMQAAEEGGARKGAEGQQRGGSGGGGRQAAEEECKQKNS